jgi:hypothetical protein
MAGRMKQKAYPINGIGMSLIVFIGKRQRYGVSISRRRKKRAVKMVARNHKQINNWREE